ncbi:Alpha/beta hydrolase family [Leishmania donovani]|uniref:ER membrane protein complex subunit 1 n=1 Tax=Leishmania donovani TaxID=5661 RepID=A0A6J8FNY1_LEIDO|nr:Alpha/beta hydrolase family [Leishmania donovani]VDZ48609.1 Protein_of_unknown_function_(DUF1620)_putative/Pfam:PF07774 [Leishmania donovani]
MLRAIPLVCVAAVLLTCLPVAAIHEDEQGLRDWIMHLVGNVQDSAAQVATNPQLLYVASEDGAVAAIAVGAYGGLNLTWRQISSATPLCVAAGPQAVLTVNNAGVATLMSPTTGSIEVTYALQTVTTTLQAAACSVVSGKAVVVTYDGATLKRFEFSTASEEQSIPVAAYASASVEVSKMYVAGSVLLVNHGSDSADVLRLDNLAKERSVAGMATSIAADGHFTTRDAATVRSFPTNGAASEVACSDCGIAVVRNAHTGEPTGVVRVETQVDMLRITYPNSVVTIPNICSSITAYPLLAFEKDDGDVIVLIKTGAHNLLLVSAAEGLVWRRFEALANVAAAAIVEPMEALDHFHFNKNILLVSRFGTLYSIPIAGMGAQVDYIKDFSQELAAAMKAPSMAKVQVRELAVRDDGRTAVVHAESGATSGHILIDLAERMVTSVTTCENAVLSTPELEVAADLSVRGSLSHGVFYTYASHAESGTIEGYSVSAAAGARPTWVVQMPSAIVAHAAGSEPRRTDVVNNLRVYPNISGREMVEEVRRTYPMRNVIAVAHYEPSEEELPSLVITAIDVVTGSILATTRHANVEGDVKMVIVEHAIVYYYLDAKKMRYCFGVWELFEDENSPVVFKTAGATIPQIIASFFVNTKREFSSRATRPPIVVVSTLGSFGGPLADMGVTTSYNAIARKSLVLAYATGRVVVVELRHLLAGNQMPLPGAKDRQMSHLLLPSFLFASHKYRVAFPRKITTEPTLLESSCHVVVSGLDLFYVRSSSGKPFDLLNSDFNKPLLITLVCGFAVLSVMARYFVNRKALNSAWQ